MAAEEATPFWAAWPHAFVETAPGIRLHYVDVGPRSAPPVVLVHGWPDLWFGWRYQIRALSSTYRLIVPDMRGFGQSSAPKNVEAYGGKNGTSDLAALLDALNIPRAVFIGHDWGGAMVWRMCLYQPSRVLAVCGICTPYTPPSKRYLPLDVVVAKVPQFAYQQILADTESTGKRLDVSPRRFFNAIFRKHTENNERGNRVGIRTILKKSGTDSDEAIFQHHSSMLTDTELDYYVEQYSQSKFQGTCQYYATRKIDFDDELGFDPVLPHRALFIAAAQDDVLKPEMARNMPKFIPNLEMKLIDGAGHWVLWEQKDRVNALLAEWLAKVAPVTVAKL